MSTIVAQTAQIQATPMLEELQRFMALPDWLAAIGQPERVRAALERAVPDFAAGRLRLRDLTIARLRLKKGQEGWAGQYDATVQEPGDGQTRTVTLGARLIAPGAAAPEAIESELTFGDDGWRCYLPELRLDLYAQSQDAALPALPVLSDPDQARELLERSIRACSPAYGDLSIQSCAIKAMRYKPGSRATVVYELAYAPTDSGRNWPPLVVAKTYSGSKGQNTYDGMRALWESPLSKGDAVTIAEPLAYIPELKVLVQGPIYEEQTLEDMLKAAMRSPTPAALAELRAHMAITARALAALHRSGVGYGKTQAWQDELGDVRDVIKQLAIAVPDLADAATPLLARLESLAAATPADPAVPSHGAFRPAQVLIYQGKVGFIDFDGFGQAEPAYDLSRFLRKTQALAQDTAKADPHSEAGQALLAEIDAIREGFLAEYERHAPVSRQRIALWEALDLLMLVLYCWTKVEPQRLNSNMLRLERHLRASGLLH